MSTSWQHQPPAVPSGAEWVVGAWWGPRKKAYWLKHKRRCGWCRIPSCESLSNDYKLALFPLDALSSPGGKWSERPEHVGAKWVKCCWFVSSWHLNPDSICFCGEADVVWMQRREGPHTHTHAAAAWRKITYIHHDARGRARWLLPTTARARMLG